MMMLNADGTWVYKKQQQPIPSSPAFLCRSFLFIFLRPFEIALLFPLHFVVIQCFVVFLCPFSDISPLRNIFLCINFLKDTNREEVWKVEEIKTAANSARAFGQRDSVRSPIASNWRRKIVQCITSNHHSIDLWCSRMTCASFLFTSSSLLFNQHTMN